MAGLAGAAAFGRGAHSQQAAKVARIGYPAPGSLGNRLPRQNLDTFRFDGKIGEERAGGRIHNSMPAREPTALRCFQ
jgi:hypothetical protein